MTLKLVISGGQTGADQAGWRAARAASIPTAGWMPAGFLTETPDGRGSEGHPEFAEMYGAKETTSEYYPRRTRLNILDSDATLWFGDPASRGGSLTIRTCRDAGRPHLVINGLKSADIAEWLRAVRVETVNIAGNRESSNPGIGARVETFLVRTFERLKKGD